MTTSRPRAARSDPPGRPGGPAAGPPVERLRQSNVAELVASALRAHILDGTLSDGDILPKQEDLAVQFGTSAPSVREGLRILEGEGLVTVRRGRLGGAVVHAPAGGSAAYMLGLVFQSRQVRLREVGAVLNDLEPICAGLCAERKDRNKTVVPRLRSLHAATSEEDLSTLERIRLARKFHEELVRGCGRETMVVLIGVLASIWSAHSTASAERGVLAKEPWAQGYREGRNAEHEELIELISQGDAAGAVDAARRHLESSTYYQMGGREAQRVIEADLLADYISLPF